MLKLKAAKVFIFQNVGKNVWEKELREFIAMNFNEHHLP